MVIGKQQKRRQIRTALFSLAFEALIAWVVAYAFDATFLQGVLIFFGLQALYFAIWLKSSLFRWANYSLFTKQEMIDGVADDLADSDFPIPESNWIRDAEQYLTYVIDETNDNDVARFRSAANLAILQYTRATSRVQESIMLDMAFEGGIKKYIESEKYLP